jgi:hypothetical protein
VTSSKKYVFTADKASKLDDDTTLEYYIALTPKVSRSSCREKWICWILTTLHLQNQKAMKIAREGGKKAPALPGAAENDKPSGGGSDDKTKEKGSKTNPSGQSNDNSRRKEPVDKSDEKSDESSDDGEEEEEEVGSIARITVEVLRAGEKAERTMVKAPKNHFRDYKDDSPNFTHEKPGRAKDQLGGYYADKIPLPTSGEG